MAVLTHNPSEYEAVFLDRLNECGLLPWLKAAVVHKASDLFLSVGEAPVLKVNGEFHRIEGAMLQPQKFLNLIRGVLPEQKLKQYEQGQEVDLAWDLPGLSRFRLSLFKHQNGETIAIRPISYEIPSMAELGLPPVFSELSKLQRGLIIITGPAGSGKSTTLAALLEAMNHHEDRHIITIEDPIEYLIPNHRSLVHQREVGWHTLSFDEGLRSALRAAPNVIVVGELRDLESIQLAVRAAETGHLVLGTLHSGTVIQAITRLIDVFEADRQSLLRIQLAQSLQAICAQRLFKRIDKSGMALATEVMIATTAVRNIIRQNRFSEIRGYMETGQREQMHTFSQSIQHLIDQQMIDPAALLEASDGSPILPNPI
jgi:twitching motility protein PilT